MPRVYTYSLLPLLLGISDFAVRCESTTTASTITTLERRSDPPPTDVAGAPNAAAAIPTLVLGPEDQYVAQKVNFPEPSGDKLQIFPTGLYDDFPADGITISFGPDLQAKIKDTIDNKCKDKPDDECLNALIPVLSNTDVGTIVKRYAPEVVYVGAALIVSISWVIQRLWNKEQPQHVKFPYTDLHQMKDLGPAATIAIQEEDSNPTTVTIPATPTPTATGNDFIHIETLSKDSGAQKAGDIIYHVPADSISRLKDLAGMLGLASVQETCKGQNLNNPASSRIRANALEDCLRDLGRLVPDLVEAAPQDLIRVAAENIPAEPPLDQPIGIPVRHLVVDGVPIIVRIYRVVALQDGDQAVDWNRVAVLSAVLGIAAAWALQDPGQLDADVWVPQAALDKQLKLQDFACPKDIICVDDDCQGQKEEEDMLDWSPVCKSIEHAGCQCDPVTWIHQTEVAHDYMDLQYAWLEELLALANAPTFSPKCDGDFITAKGGTDSFSAKIKTMCKSHTKLQDGLNVNGPNGQKYWTEVDSEPGLTWSLTWQNTKDSCAFDCEDVFLAFMTDKCVNNNGLTKNGKIDTDCGTATYVAYKPGG